MQQLIDLREQKRLTMISSNAALEDILGSPDWREDFVARHVFACAGCGRRFELSFDSYRKDGTWDRLKEQNRTLHD